MAPSMNAQATGWNRPLLPTPGRQFGGFGIIGESTLESTVAGAIENLSHEDLTAVFAWLGKMPTTFDDDFFKGIAHV